MASAAPRFTLARIDGDPLSLDALTAGGPVVLVFAHADCPTSALALRRLAGLGQGPAGVALACVAEETPEAASRLARRTGIRFPVLAEPAPFEVSRAYEIATVPTAVRIEPGVGVTGTAAGWDADAYERLLGASLPSEEPRRKPGCGARWTYEAAAGLDELEDMIERGWSDGLPVVPPTPERVETMLGSRDGAHSLGPVPPAHGVATLERLAACAVLAGCLPRYFPVVIAAAEAALDPGFNAHGIGVTTQPAGPILVVNGPVRDAIGLNSGMGALGPGARANMTIGRALRLLLTLTGGARPGELDRSTLGHPGKLGMCVAENEEASPWEPLHVERGFARETSTVTVFAGDAPLSVSDHRSRTPEELAATLAWAAAGQWSPFWWPMDDTSLFVLCPEHAMLFGAAGWAKEQVRAAIFAAAQRPAGELRRGETTPLVQASADDTPVRKWTQPELVEIVVAGGEAGRFSAVFGPCNGMQAEVVTREIQWST
ncbi:MAG: redoxin domain-containing protein [Gaiellaceae bacterium]